MQKFPPSLIALALLTGIPSASPANTSWVESSFDDFADGTFTDAGSNAYVSKNGRIQIINRWDLNNDGNLDLVLPSGHGHTEKEDAYIYLNNGHDIDGRSRIRIPTNGSYDGVIADFNKDGLNDLVLCNYDNGITYQTDTYIYYGTGGGFTANHREVLPTMAARSVSVGDFDNDGDLDLLIACSWQRDYLNEPTGQTHSFIFWNGPEGFHFENRQAFAFGVETALSTLSADLDGDQIADPVISTTGRTFLYLSTLDALKDMKKAVILPIPAVAMSVGDINRDNYPELALASGNNVTVLIGSKVPYSTEISIRVNAKSATGVALADLNRDGADDLTIANQRGPDGASWIDSTVFFSDGNGFSPEPSFSLPSMGASGVSVGDLNDDEWPDIVISNRYITNEQSIPSFIYWSDEGSFRHGNHSYLNTQGAVGNTIGDCNNDGQPDVVFFNFEGNFRDGPSVTRVFWGNGTRDFSILRATEIPTHYITSTGHADLDDDGYVDLMLTQQRYISNVDQERVKPLIICWGNREPFNLKSNLTIDRIGSGSRAVDINRDGYLDIFVGGVSNDPDRKGKFGLNIFLGSQTGFGHHNRIFIPIEGSSRRVPLVADINQDGILDLVFQQQNGTISFLHGSLNGFDPGAIRTIELGRDDELGHINAADLNGDGYLDLILPFRKIGRITEASTFIHYGSKDGYSKVNRIELPSAAATDSAVADLNGDGILDLVFHSYKGHYKREIPAYVYFGSKKGLSVTNLLRLPTLGSSGTEILDLDGDGWLDLFFANHCSDGSTDSPGVANHVTDSQIYWGTGGEDTFNSISVSHLPGIGPQTLNTVDPGNAHNRGYYEDYTSSPFEIPDGTVPTLISWQADTPHQTTVLFQVRMAQTLSELNHSKFTGPDGTENSWYRQSKTTFPAQKDKVPWIQYRARLNSFNGGSTPYLTQVKIDFE